VLASVIGVTALGLDAGGDILTLPSHLEFSPAGQPDTTLSPAAITTASPGGAVTFLPSGGFVATTPVFTGRRGDPDIQVTRFNPDGTLDPAFGTGGVLTTRIQGNDSVSLLVIQPDGKILASGASQNAAGVTELALARYLSQ